MFKFIEDFVICLIVLTLMLVFSILMFVVFPVSVLVNLFLQEYIVKPLKTRV